MDNKHTKQRSEAVFLIPPMKRKTAEERGTHVFKNHLRWDEENPVGRAVSAFIISMDSWHADTPCIYAYIAVVLGVNEKN